MTSRFRILVGVLLLTPAVAVAGCGDETEDTSSVADASADALLADPAGAEQDPRDRRARRHVPEEVVTVPAGAFTHNPHQNLDCTRCHGSVPGHDTHAGVDDCSSCHPSTETIPTAGPSDAECMTCHHGPDQTRGCEQCHTRADRRDGPVRVAMAMSVLEESAARELPFDHDIHADRDCRSCHTGTPTLASGGDCAACHSEHHTAENDCMGCHGSFPLDTHDVDVHDGCGGSGCHTDRAILDLGTSRPVCLSCHTAQVDHEAPSDCVECHALIRTVEGHGDGAGRP